MKNIRIWSSGSKRSEAVWLGYLLMLCGWQVWKGKLTRESLDKVGRRNERQYMDILLLDCKSEELYELQEIDPMRGNVCISGNVGWDLQSLWWFYDIAPELLLNDSNTLMRLVEILCNLMIEDFREKEGILRLAASYCANNNALPRSIYTIRELFCSRRIDYREYRNVNMLREAIGHVEEWYGEYIKEIYIRHRTFGESFALTYLQNMIDEAYIKAHIRGGFDTEIIWQNADYLMKREPDCNTVLFLKLQILRNCVEYQERPDIILDNYVARSEMEYQGKAYCEVGDMSRENPNKIFVYPAETYFKNINDQDPEGYCGWYKLAYLYSQRGKRDKAKEKYKQVIKSIESIEEKYRTPQEFEYYCKACYGKIKCRMQKDREYGSMTFSKLEEYQEEIARVIKKCRRYDRLVFWKKYYGNGREQEEALSFMGEKMDNIIRLLKNLSICVGKTLSE